jgi:hypothetical protein
MIIYRTISFKTKITVFLHLIIIKQKKNINHKHKMNIKNSYQTNPYTITEFKQNQINKKQKLTHLISISWYLYFISTK